MPEPSMPTKLVSDAMGAVTHASPQAVEKANNVLGIGAKRRYSSSS